MTQNNSNLVTRSNEPEQIDLIDLMLQLWRGKWVIVNVIVICILLAVGYLAIAKEKWTSTAIITQPDVSQIAAYSNALNTLYATSAVVSPVTGVPVPIDMQKQAQDVQTQAISRFSDAFSALKLSIDPSVKTQPLPLTVTFTASSAKEAQTQLAQSIQQVNDQIAQEMVADLNDSIRQQIATLQNSLKTLRMVAQEQKNLRIKQISEALKYAEASKVTTPQIQQAQDVTQETMFLLGSDALKSMIDNEASRPLSLPPEYYQLKQNLLELQNQNLTPDGIHVYRYVMKPDLPTSRNSPKKSITLIFAVLLGGIIGSGVVLGRNALRNYRPRA